MTGTLAPISSDLKYSEDSKARILLSGSRLAWLFIVSLVI
jgi:hypothetical protein